MHPRGRVSLRPWNGWCKPLPDGRQRWREDAVEPLLRASATAEVCTTAPLHEVVAEILTIVGAAPVAR